MVSRLTVTAYNVRFGDALLISVPERRKGGELVRHILIDVGNVLAGPGSDDAVYRNVVQDILDRLDGSPVDLYVMTHEHLDHVQGLLAAEKLGLTVPVDYAWLTASAREGYYDRFPEARKRLDLYRAEYERIRLAVARLGLLSLDPIRAFIDNNNPRSTAACVRYLRKVAAKKTSYVHRRFRLIPGKHHPFREAQLSIWAPELDTSAYYGRVRPLTPVTPFSPDTQAEPLRPPSGVDPEGFRVLVDFLQSGIGDNVLAIDRAANNTSLVLELEWRGWRLLFPGDAELKSWWMMHQRRQLSRDLLGKHVQPGGEELAHLDEHTAHANRQRAEGRGDVAQPVGARALHPFAKAQARQDQLPGDQRDEYADEEQNDTTVACAEHSSVWGSPEKWAGRSPTSQGGSPRGQLSAHYRRCQALRSGCGRRSSRTTRPSCW